MRVHGPGRHLIRLDAASIERPSATKPLPVATIGHVENPVMASDSPDPVGPGSGFGTLAADDRNAIGTTCPS